MSRFCLGGVEKEGELAIVIDPNRVSGCGLEARQGHIRASGITKEFWEMNFL